MTNEARKIQQCPEKLGYLKRPKKTYCVKGRGMPFDPEKNWARNALPEPCKLGDIGEPNSKQSTSNNVRRIMVTHINSRNADYDESMTNH